MQKNESASMFRGITWLLIAAMLSLGAGVLIVLAGSIAGVSSPGAGQTLMAVATYISIATLDCSVISLKLASSLPPGEHKDITDSVSWRWKPWACAVLGFVLLLASASLSV